MAIITLWNPSKKQIGQTMSAIAIGTYLSIEHNSKVLLISTECNDKMLETGFDIKSISKSMIESIVKSSKINLDSGLDGLATISFVRLSHKNAIISYSNKLTPKIIRDYTKVVFKNRLELLYAPTNKDRDNYRRILESYKDILFYANQYYDYVIVDFNKGFQTPYTDEILEISDVILVNMEQRLTKIDEYMEIKKKEKILNDKKVMLLINKYDFSSKYTIKNLSRHLGRKELVNVIPYNTLYMEAGEEGSIADFFLKIRKIDEEDKNGIFYAEVGNTVEKIRFKLQELRMTK